MTSVTNVTEATVRRELLESKALVLVDFWLVLVLVGC